VFGEAGGYVYRFFLRIIVFNYQIKQNILSIWVQRILGSPQSMNFLA
jgi:hypothetical protein